MSIPIATFILSFSAIPIDKPKEGEYIKITMSKKLITTTGKRPADASPEKALELSKTLTQAEIARLWGISRQRVQQLIKKASEADRRKRR